MAFRRGIGKTRLIEACYRLQSSVFLKKVEAEGTWGSSRMSSKRPLVGILHRFTSPDEIAQVVKTIRPDIRLDIVVKGKSEISPEEMELLRSCEVLVADPRLFVEHDLTDKLPKLQWLHSIWAGVDQLTRLVIQSSSFPEYTLTRNGAFYGLQMAEYVLGYVIARERFLFEMKEFQQQNLWKRLPYRSLSEVTLGIVGFGDIGKEIAKVAKGFQMKIWALVKQLSSDDQKLSDVEYRLTSDLPELLTASDYVVSLLPSVPSTDRFFDGEILSHCTAKKSIFINIGRGNVVEEETLIKALDRGWIGGAVLDVFQKEPLPLDSPLWTHPKVTVTPHIAGLAVDHQKIAETFIENYDRYIRGEPLKFTVDWKKGY